MDMQRLLEAEPFLGYLGLEVVEARPGTAALRLKLRREVTNHIGSVHGGAQYALGEATAIALAATLFAEEISHLDLLTANATIAYHRLACGDLTARAAAGRRLKLRLEGLWPRSLPAQAGTRARGVRY
jgi:uncharacterized protein (TIGR00369 family)